jgi:hypothetical protein
MSKRKGVRCGRSNDVRTRQCSSVERPVDIGSCREAVRSVSSVTLSY